MKNRYRLILAAAILSIASGCSTMSAGPSAIDNEEHEHVRSWLTQELVILYAERDHARQMYQDGRISQELMLQMLRKFEIDRSRLPAKYNELFN